ncbi:T9SS type A sorting domain-containing protein [Hymenobacter chitinivorans]|uniref:Putative secreted protein (Por secretion system target) n=1 Tax=Hymenobacter chitinivorans DSM 11115 TaxID=1121954 RepID=A0A2M9AQX3_9BACT|nr:T9SS type A sorting domain-containing protein [Hymenobacter chitinivorans]PJJ48088.1 putative secreted protein (Por secretion system target) [Hymenobacter chitinivorans DSM 11115]
MKKTFLRLFLLALTSAGTLTAASAQTLPNGNLETWVTRGTALAPTGWATFDDVLISLGFPIPTGTTSRSTDKHGGQYAALLENKANPLLGVTFPGVLIIGSSADLNADFPGGVPFTARPANMQFYYKLTGAAAATEMAAAQVVLTRWNGSESVIIAAGGTDLAPAANYTLQTIPLDYESSAAPDSIRILFASSTQDAPTVGSALLIDDVVMTGTALATVNAARNAAITVSPNPSNTGLFTLSTSRDASWTRSAYTVTDIAGRVVLRGAAAPVNASGQRTVDLRGQRAGLYTLRLDTPEGPVVHKLLLQ